KSPYGRQDERRAAEAITPGMLVERNSAGKAIKHATSGGPAVFELALEDALQGRTIDDAYAENDLVTTHLFQKGDEGYAWLASGQNVQDGAYLISNGAGLLTAYSGTGTALCRAVEAVDASGGAKRI